MVSIKPSPWISTHSLDYWKSTDGPYLHTYYVSVFFRLLRVFDHEAYSLTDSYISFTVKMESVSKNTIFDLKIMVKSGLEKFILKYLHAGRWLFL